MTSNTTANLTLTIENCDRVHQLKVVVLIVLSRFHLSMPSLKGKEHSKCGLGEGVEGAGKGRGMHYYCVSFDFPKGKFCKKIEGSRELYSYDHL